jgi:hypothetical protein
MRTIQDEVPGFYFLLVTEDTYKLLSDIAAKQNKTVAQVFQAAVEKYLKEAL